MTNILWEPVPGPVLKFKATIVSASLWDPENPQTRFCEKRVQGNMEASQNLTRKIGRNSRSIFLKTRTGYLTSFFLCCIVTTLFLLPCLTPSPSLMQLSFCWDRKLLLLPILTPYLSPHPGPVVVFGLNVSFHFPYAAHCRWWFILCHYIYIFICSLVLYSWAAGQKYIHVCTW